MDINIYIVLVQTIDKLSNNEILPIAQAYIKTIVSSD
jgi:hypothetical protein